MNGKPCLGHSSVLPPRDAADLSSMSFLLNKEGLSLFPSHPSQGGGGRGERASEEIGRLGATGFQDHAGNLTYLLAFMLSFPTQNGQLEEAQHNFQPSFKSEEDTVKRRPWGNAQAARDCQQETALSVWDLEYKCVAPRRQTHTSTKARFPSQRVEPPSSKQYVALSK